MSLRPPHRVSRPVIQVLAPRSTWDPDATPPYADQAVDVCLKAETAHRLVVIHPLGIRREPPSFPQLVDIVPESLIAEFDIDDLVHGRTIAFTYSSGRTVERPIVLNGVY